MIIPKIRIPKKWILILLIILFAWFLIVKYHLTPTMFINELILFFKWLLTSINL